ncbi:molecular chaperone [Herbaspirillum sp. RV1423]|uniref:fimbrial biogenesis chaperone n=1 Tax=Herbaspirillum sp. RV1423 TaxID=1443993 RepID=UPI0004B0F7CF|nr:fimbria/pilus periplasmic chaperone [Herbaspirillum sp. RV1423]
MKNNRMAAYFAAIAMLLSSASSFASVVIHGTRVIFPADEKEVTVRMTNEGKAPGLVQVWIDTGDINDKPDQTQVPFVLTPPLFRVEPGKGQTLRMIFSQKPLRQDRESIFYLNLLEVPPRPKDLDESDVNYMQMAYRTRIKIFYRPKALNTQEQYFAAPAQISWKVLRDGDAGYVLEASNPTPYYFSFTNVGVMGGAEGGKDAVNNDGGMVAPGGTERFPLKEMKKQPDAGAKVKYTFLNDYGAGVDGEGSLSK